MGLSSWQPKDLSEDLPVDVHARVAVQGRGPECDERGAFGPTAADEELDCGLVLGSCPLPIAEGLSSGRLQSGWSAVLRACRGAQCVECGWRGCLAPGLPGQETAKLWRSSPERWCTTVIP